MYKKTSHFTDMLENTKNIDPQKYTEEQYNTDLKKWFEHVKQNEKYTKGQTNWTEKYSGKINENKIDFISNNRNIKSK